MLTFFQSLSTKDVEINQRILHVIVTSAINFIKIESEEYKTINQNIKLGIYYNVILPQSSDH